MKISSKNTINAYPIIECVMGNLNGDPDNEGAPRIMPDGRGLVTGVSYKARIRGYMESEGNKIYCKRGQNLNDIFAQYGVKNAKKTKGKEKDTEEIDPRKKFCADFVDARLFGATFCEGSPIVGAVQIPEFYSVSEVETVNVSMTTPSREDGKQGSFAKRSFIPYSVYQANINYFPDMGKVNGVTDDDLELLLQAAFRAYDYKGSAALGRSCTCKIYVFQQQKRKVNYNVLSKLVMPTVKAGIDYPRDIDDIVFRSEKEIADVCSKNGIEFDIIG